MNLTLLKFTYSRLVMMNFIRNENIYDEHAFLIYYIGTYILYFSQNTNFVYLLTQGVGHWHACRSSTKINPYPAMSNATLR